METGRELAAEEISEHRATIAAMSARINELEAETERRLKLLVECRPYVGEALAFADTEADAQSLLTRIDDETGKGEPATKPD